MYIVGKRDIYQIIGVKRKNFLTVVQINDSNSIPFGFPKQWIRQYWRVKIKRSVCII